MKFFLIFFLVFCFSFDTYSRDQGRVRHFWQDKREQEKIDEMAENIPLYEAQDKLPHAYEILGDVKGEDVLTKSKKDVYLALRRKAMKLKADAVIGVRCQTVAKAVAQSCYGFAVKWK